MTRHTAPEVTDLPVLSPEVRARMKAALWPDDEPKSTQLDLTDKRHNHGRRCTDAESWDALNQARQDMAQRHAVEVARLRDQLADALETIDTLMNRIEDLSCALVSAVGPGAAD